MSTLMMKRPAVEPFWSVQDAEIVGVLRKSRRKMNKVLKMLTIRG